MKQFEVQAIGLEEMTDNEMRSLNGGAIPWGTILKIAKYVGGLILADLAGRGVEWAIDLLMSQDEEDIYDATYYGGEIDPSYCIG